MSFPAPPCLQFLILRLLLPASETRTRRREAGPRRRTLLFLLLLVPPALITTIIVIMHNMGSYGKSKLVGVIILCCHRTIVVISAVATLLASIPDLRAAKLRGPAGGTQAAGQPRLDGIRRPRDCRTRLYFLTPAVIDLAQDPQPRAVASCSYAQDTVTRSQWFTGGTSYNNHFVMRFDDGTQHTFTIATSEQDISQLPGIIHPLYEGCVLHPDQTPLTIDMYVHSKTLVDARVD